MKYIFLLLLIFSSSLQAQVDFGEYSLPLMVVDVFISSIPDEPKVTGDMKLIDNGPAVPNKPDDPGNVYDGKIGIEGRGQTSQSLFEKIGYGFETRNADGANNNVSLLGLPEENDWVLHGPYSDKSLLRNAMAYRFGRLMMDYAPRTRFVELMINGDYKGVYILTEKIKRDKNRVDIAKLKPEDNTGDQLTGGYILKIDKLNGEESFISDHAPINATAGQSIAFGFHDPKPSEITNQQKNYIENWMDDFEDVLQSQFFNDPISGYAKYIDQASFIDYFLINELTKNADAYRISTYLYKDRDSIDSKLHMGPIWDYNLGFGNVDYCTGPETTGWVYNFNYACPQDFWLVPFWWNRLLRDTSFSVQVKDRWQELRSGALSNTAVSNSIDSMKTVIGPAADRNFQRWPILSDYVWPNPFVRGSYDAEVQHLDDWLRDRMAWMDGAVESLARPPFDSNAEFEPMVFPNPGNGQLSLRFYALASQRVVIRFFNPLGQMVHETQSNQHGSGANEIILNNTDWQPGNYFYAVWFNNNVVGSGTFQSL